MFAGLEALFDSGAAEPGIVLSLICQGVMYKSVHKIWVTEKNKLTKIEARLRLITLYFCDSDGLTKRTR